MSILLDALRKSEKDQGKIEPPSIHSVTDHHSSSGYLKKGWVLLLIVVIFAGAAYAWYRYEKADEPYTPPVTLAGGGTQTAEHQPPAKSEGLTETGESKSAVASNTPIGGRTPVESFKPPNTTTGVAQRKSEDQVARSSADKTVSTMTPADQRAARMAARRKAAANKTAASQAAAKRAAANRAATNKGLADQAAANKKAANKKAANKQAANKARKKTAANKPATGKPADATPAVTGEKKFRPRPPAPINYWELPDAIRAKVPEIKFTVLVYAKKPADRFVLINGQRFSQGEEIQPEVVVKQIRREGVVFKYRLYQFLVER